MSMTNPNTNGSFDFGGETEVKPLAARLRPGSFDEYFGQSHLVGPGKPLRQAILHSNCHSLILWGPPGTGKTTLAELIAQYAKAQIIRLSAVTSGIKDIRAAIEQAQQNLAMQGNRTLLFVDEVHRFNKSQQDAFLPYIEDGTIIFVGATTENPSFELNNAILSRARVYLLKKLSIDELKTVADRALTDNDKGLGALNLTIGEAEKTALCQFASGDARKLLNYLKIISDFAESVDGQKVITKQALAQVATGNLASIDKNGDQYYDLMSAFHKSMRGSAGDAALYWYCRMLAGGCDPLDVARRLMAIASEDIGNADPRALEVARNAWDIFNRVGPAEGERAIAQAILYMAAAPKSNAVYSAFNLAKQQAENLPSFDVPLHLRNAPTKLMKELGHGDQYRYAHNEPGAFAAGENYFPPELRDQQYYHPSERGLEKKIKDKMDYLANLNHNSPQKRYESN
ncbi:MAG: putative ATPase [Phenylobacterium sp.]|jgi:putative ATPase